VLYIVLDDVGYSAMEPWGGLIETLDVSGEHYVDLELEALAMMKRE
jgi:hypothetical protein